MIKNIIFDLSEVIISGYHNAEYVVEKYTDITAEEFLKAKKETIDMFLDAMRNKCTEDEYLDFLMDGRNWNMTIDDLKACIRKNLNIPVEGTLELIKKLKPNYNLILLSDHIAEWTEYILDKNKDLDIFEKKYFSYEYEKLKTDEGIFEYVTELEDIKPEETVFVDDNPDNVKNAEKIGITGIVFENAKQLENDFKKLKII